MKLKTFTGKLGRKLLQLFFRFEKWHISPLQERKYAIDIINYCNKLSNKDSFVEIGCGLGDITRNVYFSTRIGYDIDRKVLNAAKLLPSKGNGNISYQVFEFPNTPLNTTTTILAMVNWIHHIDPNTLKNKLTEYFDRNLLPHGEIIIDTVQDPAYKFNHNIDFLTKDLNCSVYRLGEYERKREVWAIKKLN